VFQWSSNVPCIAFCTPEYLFGTPLGNAYIGTSGQFSSFLEKNFFVAMINEARNSKFLRASTDELNRK